MYKGSYLYEHSVLAVCIFICIDTYVPTVYTSSYLHMYVTEYGFCMYICTYVGKINRYKCMLVTEV